MQLTSIPEEINFERSYLTDINTGNFDENDLIVEVFKDEDLLDNLGVYWRDLSKRADATICMSFEWAYNWWKHFGRNKNRSLFIITVWDGTKIVALAPFYRGYSSIGPYRAEERIQLIGSGGSPNEQLGYLDDYGISDFLDIIVDPEFEEPVARMFSKIITSGSLDADTLTFHQARDDSFILNHLYPLLQKTDLEMELQNTDTCPYIDLRDQDTLKNYIKEQKSNARRRLRQTLRAIGPENEYVIEEAQNWDDVREATENIIKLHQDRWNQLGFPGVFHDDRFTEFFKDTVKYAFENDWLWFKQAKDKEGVCASRMLLRYNNRYFDYISGFDDNRDSSKYRPGIGLLLDVVKDGLETDAATIELLRGEEEYKYDFTDKNFNNWKLRIPLTKNPPLVKRWGAQIMAMTALLYKHITRESRLLKVQRQQSGIMQMVPGYLAFRWKSIKLKMKNN